MRKKLLISLICGNLLMGSAVSAESPFADAPSWSYQPIAELINAKLLTERTQEIFQSEK